VFYRSPITALLLDSLIIIAQQEPLNSWLIQQ